MLGFSALFSARSPDEHEQIKQLVEGRTVARRPRRPGREGSLPAWGQRIGTGKLRRSRCEPGEPVKPEGVGWRALWVERQVRHHRADGAREFHSVRCATRLKPGPRRLVSEAG